MRINKTPLKDPIDAFQLQSIVDEIRNLLEFIDYQKGNGSPEDVVAANVGAIFMRLDGGTGTTFYVKESGQGTKSGWVAK